MDTHTELEEVDASLVTTYVQIIVEETAALESQLSEVVTTVIPKKESAARLEELSVEGTGSTSSCGVKFHTYLVYIGDSVCPLVRVQCAQNKNQNDNVDAPWFQSWWRYGRSQIPYSCLDGSDGRRYI